MAYVVLSGNSAEPSSGSIVVPKESTEPQATADGTLRWPGRFRHDQPILQALVIPLSVIVFGEGDERATQMRRAQDHEAVQTFFLDRSDEPFGVRVAVGRRVGRLDH